MNSVCIKAIGFVCAAVAAMVMLLWMPPACLAGQWHNVAQMIGPNDAVAVFDPDGRVVYAKNADAMKAPASTLKLLTALCALDHLGKDFRFVTQFYVNDQNDLIIKGNGDPLLISQQVARIAKVLAGRVDEIRHLILDDTWIDAAVAIPGTRGRSVQPYDAPVGALCVNFNTISVKKKGNAWASAEPQTPLLPAAIKRLKQQPHAGRILLSSKNRENLTYAGQLFAHFLAREGLAPAGKIRFGQANPERHRLIYRHESPFALTEVVSRLMAYSNNFVANQVLLAVGAKIHGPPASLEKGVRVVNAYARKKLGISPQIVEGSGISRRNQMTARMFGPLLFAFSPYHDLLTEQNGIFYKTGTLHGIQTRAGFITHQQQLYGFAVMIHTPGKAAEPVASAIAARIRSLK